MARLARLRPRAQLLHLEQDRARVGGVGHDEVERGSDRARRAHAGGHAAAVPDECVFRFEFPERPGALFNFLNKLGGHWNISMFHYRNHGAADGRVLAALQVPHEERHLIPAALDAIGYPYWDETHNPAYQLFLG